MSKERRLVIINYDRCNPKKCPYNCMRVCPPQRSGKDVFSFDEEGYPIVNEELCIGCGLCVKACNFKAIKLARVPLPLENELVHRYGPNQFELYRLPLVSPGEVMGLLGQNGTGKSTSLKILAGLIKPNFGDYQKPPDWDEIIKRFRGTALQNHFKGLANGTLKVIYKPQDVDKIPLVIKDIVKDVLEKYDEQGRMNEIADLLGFKYALNKRVNKLSGGELQKFAIAVAILRSADLYLFDEPSSYLDIRERIRIAQIISDLAETGKTIVVAEHDLALLDYISTKISLYYGVAGAFGIVSKPKSTREGINIFLNGYDPAENYIFRNTPIKFRVYAPKETTLEEILLEYPPLEKRFGEFHLTVEAGAIYRGIVVGIAGPNATGKSTFIKIIAGKLKPDNPDYSPPQDLDLAYKPQYLKEFIQNKEWLTVRELIRKTNPQAMSDTWYRSYIVKPFNLEYLFDRTLDELSGGELQKVAIATTFAKDADIYLLDEPGAFISAEDRFLVAKAIRDLTQRRNSAVLVVEHDVLLLDYISDKLIVFDGEPGKYGHASKPLNLKDGMNLFLKLLDITFRRDPETYRPRINKKGSRLDIEQKARGEYYYLS